MPGLIPLNNKLELSYIPYRVCWGNPCERLCDIVCSFFLLALLTPLFLVVAILIKMEGRGPILFLQKRSGKMGREFYMYKFRTMVTDAELLKTRLKNEVDGPMFKMANDPRVTKTGRILRKWSIDELPQLLNVLKGEMSLVGPRPLAHEEMAGDELWKTTRLSVKPGLTGLWQIKGRRSGKFSDWVMYDIEYVQNKSFLADIKILFSTVIAVFRNKGVS